MKKVSVVFLFVSLFIAVAHAQVKPERVPVFNEGNKFVSVGYGFGTYWAAIAADVTDNEDFHFSITGPLYAKYEYALASKFGLGINIAYVKYHFQWLSDYYYNSYGQMGRYSFISDYSSWSFLMRANWHFGKNEKIDPYLGIGLGYRTGTVEEHTNDPNGVTDDFTVPIPFGFETTIGLRMMFTDRIGAYAEVGLAKSAMQIGLTAKF